MLRSARTRQSAFRAEGNWNNNDDFFIDNVNIAYTTTTPTHFSISYTENGAPVPISLTSSITDSDAGDGIKSGLIVLTDKQAGDFLAINGTVVGNGSTDTLFGIGYTVTETAGSITVALSNAGELSHAAYQNFIKAVTFGNNSDNPSTAPRHIDVTVNDGVANSNTATTTINVTAVVPPEITGGDVLYLSSTGSGDLTFINRVSFSDADAGQGAVRVTFNSSNDDDEFTAQNLRGAGSPLSAAMATIRLRSKVRSRTSMPGWRTTG